MTETKNKNVVEIHKALGILVDSTTDDNISRLSLFYE